MNLRADDCQDERAPREIAVLVVRVDCTQRLAMTWAARATMRPREVGDGNEGAHEEEVQNHLFKYQS